MGRVLTILGAALILAAGAAFLRPYFAEPPAPDPDSGLYLPPDPVVLRTHPALERALLPKEEHEALAAMDLSVRGEHDHARGRLTALVEKDGGNAARFAVLGMVELSAGQPAAAGEAFEKAMALAPRFPLALLGRGRLRLATRRFAGAKSDFACLGLGDAEAAFRASERAVELAPAARPVLRTMASCLLRLGREREPEISRSPLQA